MSGVVDHERAFELLPWLANGTLPPAERDGVERHVRDCLACRAELKEQRALQALVRQQATVHLSAEQGFERLRRQLHVPRARERRLARVRALFVRAIRPGRFARGATRRSTRGTARGFAAAAAVACVAVGLGAWLAWTARHEAAGLTYETLTEAAPGDGVRLDLIFADGTTEEQMRALLAELDGTIVGGPTGLGRYTVQLDATGLADEDVDALVRRLLADERVRFAGRAFGAADRAEERQ